MTQHGTLGTPTRPTRIDTELLDLLNGNASRLVGLGIDARETDDGVIVFSGASGQFSGNAVVWINGTGYPVQSAEWVDGTGTPRPVVEWHLGPRGAPFGVAITNTNAPVTVGDTLDVAIDVTNNGTSSDSDTISLEAGGQTVDSQTVPLGSGVTGSIVLQWTPQPGDAGQQTLTVSSSSNSTTTTVPISAGPVGIDTFELYSTGGVPPGYTAVNTHPDAGVTDNRAYSGSNSLNIRGPTDNIGFDETITKSFSATQPSTLQVRYWENGYAAGGAIRWLDSSGEVLAIVGSANPAPKVVSASGVEALSSNIDDEKWHKFTLTLNLPAGTFDVTWQGKKKNGTDASKTLSGLSFIDDPSDVAEVQFGGYALGSMGLGKVQETPLFLVDDVSAVDP